MARRTYLIGLWLAMSYLHRYMTRWFVSLADNMTAPQSAAFDSLKAELETALPLFKPADPIE